MIDTMSRSFDGKFYINEEEVSEEVYRFLSDANKRIAELEGLLRRWYDTRYDDLNSDLVTDTKELLK